MHANNVCTLKNFESHDKFPKLGMEVILLEVTPNINFYNLVFSDSNMVSTKMSFTSCKYINPLKVTFTID
jgi:hypothetical protein